jgi:hypothetical protein
MTAIGKLLAVLNLVAGLGLLSWSVNLYVHRPGWLAEPPEFVEKGNSPVGFKQLKVEADGLFRRAAFAGEAWGTHLKALEAREEVRRDRRARYAERLVWAHTGNPADRIDKDNPKSPGKGFYEPVVDPVTKLYDLTVVGGVPRGAKAVPGTDGAPLPGLDGLLNSIADDTAASVDLEKKIQEKEAEFDRIKKLVTDTQERAIKMGVIRDSVQAELFFLSTFEVNVFETRETVFRRERQLRGRLKALGVGDP